MPDLHTIEQLLAAAAATTIGAFVIAVVVDDVLGVAAAVIRPANRETGPFDWSKLPSFLESQFGTLQAAALAGLVVTAASTAFAGALIHGGLTAQALQGIADAALAAATTGAATMTVAVLRDAAIKGAALLGRLEGGYVPAKPPA